MTDIFLAVNYSFQTRNGSLLTNEISCSVTRCRALVYCNFMTVPKKTGDPVLYHIVPLLPKKAK